MTSSGLLQTVGLTKDYGQRRALDGLTLHVAAGEIFGLLGPNGSGKSTAIRLLLGMLRPTGGAARVDGYDCWRESLQVRQRVSYLPGELRLYDNLTGRQLLQFLAQLRGHSLQGDAETLARRFSIDLARPLAQLSSGMKRKIALMQVILARTPLAILDEPTNTLDPTMRDELLDQIKEAKERGQAVLFSSHVLHEVEYVSDRVGILSEGKLVHLQSLADLRSQRKATVTFHRTPSMPLPHQVQAERNDLTWRLHIEGDLQPTLAWLAQADVAELRLEPEGLSGIYHRYHASDREALRR
jgi:ABC-2 type transport system ATP-binding protein